MNASAFVASGQRRAEELMVDTCTIRRKTGTALNETTGKYTDTTATIYTGMCKIQDRVIQGEVEAGGRQVVILSSFLHVPMSVTTVQVDDVAEITASQDPAAVGRKLRVAQLFYKSYATARRLQVEDTAA